MFINALHCSIKDSYETWTLRGVLFKKETYIVKQHKWAVELAFINSHRQVLYKNWRPTKSFSAVVVKTFFDHNFEVKMPLKEFICGNFW